MHIIEKFVTDQVRLLSVWGKNITKISNFHRFGCAKGQNSWHSEAHQISHLSVNCGAEI